MIETLKCPTCGAPLEYDPQTAAETVRCPFCANTAVIPNSDVDERLGQRARRVRRHPEEVEGEPLGRLRADARQPGELLDQPRDRLDGGLHGISYRNLGRRTKDEGL